MDPPLPLVHPHIDRIVALISSNDYYALPRPAAMHDYHIVIYIPVHANIIQTVYVEYNSTCGCYTDDVTISSLKHELWIPL